MKIENFQDIFLERLKRQNALKEIEIHAGGYCIHLGKISYGFIDYFLPMSPAEMNYKINTLYDRHTLSCKEQFITELNYQIIELFLAKENTDFTPKVIAYNNFMDNIFFIDKYHKLYDIVRIIKICSGENPYTYINICSELLTDENLNLLKKLEITEIRTDRVFVENIERARKMDFIITVIIDANPKDKIIFEKLAELNGKIHHLIIQEIKVTKNNLFYSNDRKIYKDLFHYVWDEGFTYNVFEEVINKKYNFSVLDFNSSVERLLCPYFSGGSLFNFLPNDESYFKKRRE